MIVHGPSGAGSRGVTPVYLRCTQGRLSWKHPRGALRVLLRLPPSNSRHLPFRACVRPLKASGGSRIWLEERARLRPLFPEVLVRRGRGGRTECTTSRNGQVALFVEAEGADKELTFAYHLQPLPDNGHYDPSEECRPCSTEELARAFCSSDLVARGRITATEEVDEHRVTQLSVRVTKVLRAMPGDPTSEQDDANSSQENVLQAPPATKVVITVGQHCGARHGEGEFVFMARRRLGDLALTCAPRLEDWAMLSRKLNRLGSAHCVLQS
ncbi:hypothetical protein B566_EDAN004066 [Ephemera danica]|nr:hypothetical protein B566_EDAN004066 [Ephemera danica]